MSLYNLIHGENPMAALLLAALGLTRESVPRYRDCYWTGEHIAIHTRTGGGNRDHYQEQNDALCAVEGYTHDVDDAFDCTYATFYFKPNQKLLEILRTVPAADATPAQRWQMFFDKLQSGESDVQTTRVMEAMRPLMEQLSAALK